MSKGLVFDIKEFAVFDGPGIRTTVFLKGCPLRCMWCHNPEGIRMRQELMVSAASCTHCMACASVCPLVKKGDISALHALSYLQSGKGSFLPETCLSCGACTASCRGGFRKIAGKWMEAQELAERLSKDADVYALSEGGVTFSGGDPLLQWDFVEEVLEDLVPGIHTAIETSGFSSDEVFRRAMKHLSLIMIDYKLTDPELHRKYTGVPNEGILRHIRMLAEGETPFILRMPLIPGVNDNRAHFEAAAALLKGAKALVRVDLLPYQRAAGAKYEMVGREYKVDFDEEKRPEIFPEVFEKSGIPYQLFR